MDKLDTEKARKFEALGRYVSGETLDDISLAMGCDAGAVVVKALRMLRIFKPDYTLTDVVNAGLRAKIASVSQPLPTDLMAIPAQPAEPKSELA